MQVQVDKKMVQALIIVKNSCFIYFQTGRSATAKFVYSGAEIADLEIIDSGILEKHLQQFIIDENLVPGKLLIILSPEVTFQKEIPFSQNLENSKLAFLENVPFENVGWRAYRRQKGINIVAANKSFYETLQSIFKLKGYTVEKVIPAVSLPEDLKKLTLENISSLEKILKKDMALNNLSLNYPEFSEKKPIAEFTKNQFNTNKNLSLLLLLFLGAILILLGSYLLFGR